MSIVLCGDMYKVAINKRLEILDKDCQSDHIRRMTGVGHVAYMGEIRNWHRIFVGKTEWEKSFERHRDK
jgi:hypothetical protein